MTTTPTEHHEKIAANNLAAAERIAKIYENNEALAGEVREAAAAVRLLLVGALTDPTVTSSRARQVVRTHLRDLMHADAHSRAVAVVFRRCFNVIDGKE